MAVSFDVKTEGANTTGTLTTTVSHTVTSSGSNRLLVVCINGAGATTPPSPTGITYAGTPLTQLSGTVFGTNNGSTRGVGVEIWYLVNPATGANNVVVTYALAATALFNYVISSWLQVNQTTPFGTPVGSNYNNVATGTTVGSTTSGYAGSFCIDVTGGTGTGTVSFSAGGSQTTIMTQGSQFRETGRASYKAGAASVAMSWVATSAANMWLSYVSVPLVPDVITSTRTVSTVKTELISLSNPFLQPPEGLRNGGMALKSGGMQ